MSEKIEVDAGPEGGVKCTFNGDALELVGYTAAMVHLPVGSVPVKCKKKPDKDGGQTFYFVTPPLSSRVELFMHPDDIAGTAKLVDAALAAGAKTI